MTPSQTFLPKDRDGALREIAGRLYLRLADIMGEPMPNDTPVFADEQTFIRNLLDIIERS